MNQNQGESESLNQPGTFWITNTITLFERTAFFAIAPFSVVYFNEILGISPVFSTLLNGSIFWGLLYILPIWTGFLTQKIGIKRTMGLSFFIISSGYFMIGNVQRFWPGIIGLQAGKIIDYTIPVILGILLLGIGRSLVQSAIAGSIQQTSKNCTIFGLGIFYLIINIGSITGRGISYLLRTRGLKLFPLASGGYFIHIKPDITNIFSFTATLFSLIALFLVIFLFKDPEIMMNEKKESDSIRKETVSQIFSGIFMVLRNKQFFLFLISMGFVWILYSQIFNLIPLFLRFVDRNAPVEIYTLVNPVMVLTSQLLLVKSQKKWTAFKSIIISVTVATLGILINMIPILCFPDITKKITLWGIMIPIGGIFILLTLAFMAIGEIMLSPAMIKYISLIAPKGKEKLFQGYANLPVALGMIIGAPMGGALFEYGINAPFKSGKTPQAMMMWMMIGVIGFIALFALVLYDRLLLKKYLQMNNPD